MSLPSIEKTAKMQDLTDPQQGLSEAEASRRLKKDGANALPVSKPQGALHLLWEVVSEPMFLLLVACGVIYLLLGDRNEALMLLGFVFIVMGITFVQQRRTEQSLSALRDMANPRALVVRDGKTRHLPGPDLVCGDIVLLAEGDRVPADMALLEAANLSIDESMLTGESVPVLKDVTSTADGVATAFSGTLITQGTARGCVIATGERSTLGRIGKSLSSLGGELTPIQEETRYIVKRVALVGLGLASLLALAYGLLNGDWLHGLLAGLTFAMAVLPEELPVVLTLFLGLGAWRLAREKVLARSIPAVELLGATTVLCVDKTGTLTCNKMAVRRLWSETAVYDTVADKDAPLQEDLHGLLEYAVLASHRRAFDPMETAIGESGKCLLADTEHLHGDWTLVDDYPLSKEMLAMSRVWHSPDQREQLIAAKGAPEAIVDLCHMDAQRAANIAAQVARLASEGLRVLGVACAVFASETLPGKQHDFDFVFLGLIALEDPLRPDVAHAIAECHAAGIRVVMITGDHPATACAIAAQAGLPTTGDAMTGSELQTLSDAALQAKLSDTHIFCRVQPEQKLRLVQAFRARGDIVAMTGDGVNDAPALKAANIGVAMGARGTDVAREAAALVLLGDDFSSLVTAVRYGRRVFANLRKAIAFLIAAHVPIVGLSLIPVMLGWPMLLMPVHILFLQLIIDPACSIVFEAEPLEPSAMRSKPRNAAARLFDKEVLVRGLWQGGGLLVLLIGVFAITRHVTHSDETARALMFTVLVMSNIGLIRANRAWGVSTLHRDAARNPTFAWIALGAMLMLTAVMGIPVVSRLFAFTQPTPLLLAAGVGVAFVSLLWFEGVKASLGRRSA